LLPAPVEVSSFSSSLPLLLLVIAPLSLPRQPLECIVFLLLLLLLLLWLLLCHHHRRLHERVMRGGDRRLLLVPTTHHRLLLLLLHVRVVPHRRLRLLPHPHHHWLLPLLLLHHHALRLEPPPVSYLRVVLRTLRLGCGCRRSPPEEGLQTCPLLVEEHICSLSSLRHLRLALRGGLRGLAKGQVDVRCLHVLHSRALLLLRLGPAESGAQEREKEKRGWGGKAIGLSVEEEEGVRSLSSLWAYPPLPPLPLSVIPLLTVP